MGGFQAQRRCILSIEKDKSLWNLSNPLCEFSQKILNFNSDLQIMNPNKKLKITSLSCIETIEIILSDTRNGCLPTS